MQKWGFVDGAQCECGDPLQIVEHIITSCPERRPPNGERGLIDLDDTGLAGLARLNGTEGRRTYARRILIILKKSRGAVHVGFWHLPLRVPCTL